MPTLKFRLESDERSYDASVPIAELIVAGWTARDMAAVQHHMAELARLSVKPPSKVPLFYRVGANLLTQDRSIQAVGRASSGEVEPVIFGYAGEMWLTVGSDHTDREVEAYSVAVSKQMCPKPVACIAWRFRDVEPDWDRLTLRSFVLENGASLPYQDGELLALRTPRDLLQHYGCATLEDGTMMSCGTLNTLGGVRPSTVFMMMLEDPVRRRVIRHEYSVTALPLVS